MGRGSALTGRLLKPETSDRQSRWDFKRAWENLEAFRWLTVEPVTGDRGRLSNQESEPNYERPLDPQSALANRRTSS